MKCRDDVDALVIRVRRSSHEERGLKFAHPRSRGRRRGRSSHEERGLKFFELLGVILEYRRSSHEERGLKSSPITKRTALPSRSSHEERGLKFHRNRNILCPAHVAPRMRSVD